MVSNPYARPESDVSVPAGRVDQTYPGIGRLIYFAVSLGTVVLFALVLFGLIAVASNDSAAVVISFLTLFMVMAWFAAVVVLGVQRLRNTGYNPWLVLLFLVPIANIWVGWVCIATPQGYADHRTLDTAGKVVTGLYALMLILSVIGEITAPRL